jgi:hypothetical protein
VGSYRVLRTTNGAVTFATNQSASLLARLGRLAARRQARISFGIGSTRDLLRWPLGCPGIMSRDQDRDGGNFDGGEDDTNVHGLYWAGLCMYRCMQAMSHGQRQVAVACILRPRIL